MVRLTEGREPLFRFGSKAFSAWIADTLIERLGSDAEWAVARNGIYQVPVGWFLKGLATTGSRDGFYVFAYTYPLTANAPDFLALNYSRQLMGPEGHTFPLPSKDTAEHVADQVTKAWRMQSADDFLETRGSPKGFLEYVDSYRRDAPDQGAELYAAHGIAAGACHLLLGHGGDARRELSYVPTELTQDHPQQDVHLARELLRCLSDGGTAAAMVRLASVREAALAAQLKSL